jgi:hypothetical protein
LESVSKEDSFDIHHDHIQWKKNLGIGLKFEVVIRIGFLTQKCETTKYMKLNKEKWDSRNETRKKLRNETNFYFWRKKRNETKFRCLFCFAKQAKFRETIFFVSLCFMFRETKKMMRNGNPTRATGQTIFTLIERTF